jgi:hypothetical protein
MQTKLDIAFYSRRKFVSRLIFKSVSLFKTISLGICLKIVCLFTCGVHLFSHASVLNSGTVLLCLVSIVGPMSGV